MPMPADTTRTPTAPAVPGAQSPYFNRELSWLEFNQRVLDEAFCESNPLLERLKFLAITGSNLDEFFMVRVGGLKLLAGDPRRAAATDLVGLTPAQQLQQIGQRVRQLNRRQYECLLEHLEPALAQAGLRRLELDELNARQLEHLRSRFLDEIASVVSPIALHDRDEFPLLIWSAVCLCVRLENRAEGQLGPPAPGASAGAAESSTAPASPPADDRFAVIPVSRTMDRFWYVPAEDQVAYVLLEDVIARFVEHFFPGQQVLECDAFRVTRNADLALDEDSADDLLTEMQQLLEARKVSECVRLEVADTASAAVTGFLQRRLGVDDPDVYTVRGPIDLAAMGQLTPTQGFDSLRNPAWPPLPSPDFPPGRDVFEIIRERDRLLYHPYQAFDPVVELVERAAEDADVIAIKQTLYRTSRNSPIVAALAQAAANGKHVTAIVELKARFDEARNIGWARQLERAGVDVVYGVRGLKTHAKLCIIVRREPDGIRRYLHLGTGNYNESTARLYSDASLLTCNQQLGADAVSFFNAITGYSVPQPMQALSAAPINLREQLLELVDIEIQNAQNQLPAAIAAKVNSLVDRQIIDALYRASQAGVRVRLNVRGICALRPGLRGLSDNIRVVSIIDRFLEHARIFCFHHGSDQRLLLASADWMARSFDRRVELMFPVEEPNCKRRLLQILNVYFQDNVKAHELQPDGSYQRRQPGHSPPVQSQARLYQLFSEELEETRDQPTVFEPHRA